MSEETRHRFNRLYLYTILFAFLTVTMTFVVFSSVAQVSLSCAAGQFVNFIGTTSDSCGPAMVRCGSAASQIQCGNWSCTTPVGGIRCTQVRTFSPAFSIPPKVYINLNPGAAGTGNTFTYGNVQFMAPTSTGQTWNPIPAGTPEIFGDLNGEHELYVDMSTATNVRFDFTCTSTATLDDVTLSSQFSYDNGATWHFTVDGGLGDVHLSGLNVGNGGIGDCGLGGSGDVLEPVGSQANHFAVLSHNMNVSTPNLSNLLFRFVALGSSGVGDVVTLTEIKMEIQTTGIIRPNNDVLSFFFSANAITISASQFTVSANIVGFCGCASSTRVISGNWTAIAS